MAGGRDTQVAIIGAGPAGLVLARLLHLAGIECVVLEARSRVYVEQRVRAGVIEQASRDLLLDIGVGARLEREGLVHRGIEIRFDGAGHRIPLSDYTGGRTITIYGQQEIVKDLLEVGVASGDIRFEISDVRLRDLETARPAVDFVEGGQERTLRCDVIAGCDGFHGVARAAVEAGAARTYDHVYPFSWLGILAAVAPAADELIYAQHERGFALLSMRSPSISRLYLQVEPDEDLAAWSDDRIWSELGMRLATTDGWALEAGPILDKGITPMRSFVIEPMRVGRLFLAGDAAHIVPATGAKGMNLAIADAWVLSRAIATWYRTGSTDLLDRYSEICLRRVWWAQEFSSSMSTLLHRLPMLDPYERRLQQARLQRVVNDEAFGRGLAIDYVGRPLPLV